MLHSATGRLRAIGLLEGLSFLLLLFVAMPLKYLAGQPLAVKYAGWAHGVFFVLYLLAVAQVAGEPRWTARKLAFALLAAVVPFGPFVLDARLRREEREAALAAEQARPVAERQGFTL